ncbi:MAG: hypothetical protein JWP11_2088, partial [Frankiales bacterium]|nr:hypothetical protein [Frankiales bacterium]
MSSTPTGGHLDLDALADALAADGSSDTHLAGCPDCRAALDELRVASALISTQLGALPAVALPGPAADRLHRALAAPDGAGVTTLPRATARPTRQWLPAAAAVVLLLAGAGYGISRLGGSDGSSATSAAGKSAGVDASAEINVVRNSSGADYTDRASLVAAVPGLLAGTAVAPKTAAAPAPGRLAPANG